MDATAPAAIEDVTIPGAPANPYRETAERYDYALRPSTCPACGDVGWPWNGWFHCDGSTTCGLIAVVDDGRCFRPVARLLAEATT